MKRDSKNANSGAAHTAPGSEGDRTVGESAAGVGNGATLRLGTRYDVVVKPMSLRSVRGVGALMAGVALSGCSSGVSFDSPDSAARLRAIQRAGAEGDRGSIPKLIEMLESDDAAVRLTAIGVLEEMTGERLGYDATAPSYGRSPAVDRWYKWWDERSGASTGVDAERGANGSRREGREAAAGDGVARSSDAGGPAHRNKDVAGGALDRGRGGLFA
jgi:hypothetical protein